MQLFVIPALLLALLFVGADADEDVSHNRPLHCYMTPCVQDPTCLEGYTFVGRSPFPAACYYPIPPPFSIVCCQLPAHGG